MDNKYIDYALECLGFIDDTISPRSLDNAWVVTVNFPVKLPAHFIENGQTDEGVKSIEPVTFVFNEDFPFESPIIKLRDNFPKVFPHINPSEHEVIPCIYAGKLTDLLVQPNGFNNIIYQIQVWLTRAARHDLMDYSQGWEPRMTSNLHGLFYLFDITLSDYTQMNTINKSHVNFVNMDNFILLAEGSNEDKIPAENKLDCFILKADKNTESSQFDSSSITNIEEMLIFAKKNNINDIRTKISKNDISFSSDKKWFVIVLVVRRPVNLINKNSPIENHAFCVENKWDKKTNRIHMKAMVREVIVSEYPTPTLLKKFSGFEQTPSINILQIGCGSLGSKIVMHLARTGIANFTLLDDDYWSAHNNARHACYASIPFAGKKTDILASAIHQMHLPIPQILGKKCQDINLSTIHCDWIIDSTANPIVKDWLVMQNTTKPVIHTALYDDSKFGILLHEGKKRNPRIDDLFCYLCQMAQDDKNIRTALFKNTHKYLATGTGCGSLTVQASDQRISLLAAGMTGYIQKTIIEKNENNGILMFGHTPDDVSLSWQNVKLLPTKIIPATDKLQYEVRILGNVVETIKQQANAAAHIETGGGLIGHISRITNCIIITGLIPPPADSKFRTSKFVMGIDGLRKQAEKILRYSQSELTYIGTWHSHPCGGGASLLDSSTKKQLTDMRSPEPTVCLLYSGNEILLI